MTACLVPAAGAELYVERRGAGPPLLLIPGGGGDCGLYSGLADLLAAAGFTAVSYDRRGNSRSKLRQSPAPITMAEQSDDAAAVLRACGFASAAIFGSSGGATIALDLAARYPRLASAVVAHEPPVPRVLPDADRYLAAYDEIDQILRTDGWRPAFWRFQQLIGNIPAAARPATPGLVIPDLERAKRLHGNWEYLMRFELQPFAQYLPDLDRIAANQVPVAVGAGAGAIARTGRDAREHSGAPYDPFRQCRVIAARLGTEVAEFPGGHFAATELPGPFAIRLVRLLRDLGVAAAGQGRAGPND